MFNLCPALTRSSLGLVITRLSRRNWRVSTLEPLPRVASFSIVQLSCSTLTTIMSSPPMEFPSSDVEMHEDALPATDPPQSDNNPLFLGTPQATPVRGSAVAARRALGLSTPRRAPREARESSPMLQYPSSSPAKPRVGGAPGSSAVLDSDPLQFPS